MSANVTDALFRTCAVTGLKVNKDNVSGYIGFPGAPTNAIACIISDDGSAPRLNEGDTVVFEPGGCDVGDLVVVCDAWGNGLVRTMQTKNGKTFYVADYQGYRQLDDNEVSCFGRVWGVIKKIAK